MKLSQFNIKSDIDDEVLIFNTLSTAFVKLSEESYQDLLRGYIEDFLLEKLVDNGILVEETYDEVKAVEYKFYSHVFDNRSLSLMIAPTMKCNFSCYYCFEGGHKQYGLMDDSIAEKLVQFIASNKPKPVQITWFGGEPLLGFSKIEYISRRLIDKEIAFEAKIITNGSLLSEEVIEKLSDLRISDVQISIDGIQKDHDNRRVYKNGSPTFETINNNIKNLLLRTDIKLTLSVAVDHNNSTAYTDVVNFVEQNYKEYLMGSRIRVYNNYVQDRTNFDNGHVCFTEEQILEADIQALTEMPQNNHIHGLPRQSVPCMFRCSKSFAIDSKGNIFKCLEHLGQKDLKIGSLNEGSISFRRILETSFSNLPFDDNKCRQCAFLPICLGGCPIDRIKVKAGKLDSCCSIYKKNLTKLLPYIYKKTKSRQNNHI